MKNPFKKLALKALDVVRNYTARDPELYHLGGLESSSGQVVTADRAMQHEAVWSCVRIIAETIASLQLNLYMRTPDGRKLAVNHNLQFLLHDMPNSDTTAVVFWESVVAAMLLQGNAYIEKYVRDGKVESLRFLAPANLNVQKDLNGNKRFFYRKDNGQQVEILRSRIWQLQGFTLDGKDGVSAIKYGAEVFGTALAADRQAGRTFLNGMMQNVYYSVAAFLTKDQRDIFKANVQDSVERGTSPILEGGIDVKALGLNPSDAQLLESRSYSVEAICRWFRVPPSMVGHSGKTPSWGTGIEQNMIGFLTFTLAPWLKRIEQGIMGGLLSPGERSRYFAQFSVKDLLRADSAARAAFNSVMVNNGIMTRDEAREDEGLPKLGGKAAVLTVQSAMVPLDMIGQNLPPASASPTAQDTRALVGMYGGATP